jgi:hypothetical protein
MTIRDNALGALADQERAQDLARQARVAAKHEADANRTRRLLAGLGATDMIVDGPVFILLDEDFHGEVDDNKGTDEAKVFWWTQPHSPGQGGTYDSVTFRDLPSLGRALKKIDAAKAKNRFHQDPPNRTTKESGCMTD